MAFSCEIQQPSRSNKTIRINGVAPFNEGSNDKFTFITDDQTAIRLAINPTIHVNKKQVATIQTPYLYHEKMLNALDLLSKKHYPF